jgi:hypothetical protein
MHHVVSYIGKIFTRIKVFNPAIKEITKQLEWDIKVKNIKAGRTIKELEIAYIALIFHKYEY